MCPIFKGVHLSLPPTNSSQVYRPQIFSNCTLYHAKYFRVLKKLKAVLFQIIYLIHIVEIL